MKGGGVALEVGAACEQNAADGTSDGAGWWCGQLHVPPTKTAHSDRWPAAVGGREVLDIRWRGRQRLVQQARDVHFVG